MNQGKTIGYILIGIGVALFVIAALWAFTYPFDNASTRIFVLIFALIVTAPLVGLGVFTRNKGSAEAVEQKQIARQQKLLSMVMTQGKVDIASATIELGVTRDQTKQLIYDLIGKQLFSGYVDWDDGVLYSAEASKLKDGTCPKCGGKLELAGKGLVKCPFCGSEVFLAN
jgi:DNA-directed RNA polymerase subunit RPC12/RpoP